MNPEEMLAQAQQMIDGAIRGDTATGTFYTLQGIGYALVAIGRELQALNAKRPGIVVLRVNGSDPAAGYEPNED